MTRTTGNRREFILYRSEPDGSVSEIQLPTRKIVCPRCDGSGAHVNPAIDGNGLTAEDFAADPDFAEDYVAGVYDVVCEECGGANVVDDLDEDRVAAADLDAYRRQEDEYRRDYDSEAWLRRAEAGP